MEERMPDIKTRAMRLARIRKRRLFAGVERRERDKNDPAEINPSLKGECGTPFCNRSSEAACASREPERASHPPSRRWRARQRRNAGERDLAYFRAAPE